MTVNASIHISWQGNFVSPPLCVSFLNKYCKSPVIIGAMTGGCDEGEAINRHLAEAAEYCLIPMALGSQRAAIELNLQQNARRWAPNAILLGNLGATQLAKGGLALAQSAIETISANALIVHLNPLQELAQPSGDHNWTGVLRAIEICCVDRECVDVDCHGDTPAVLGRVAPTEAAADDRARGGLSGERYTTAIPSGSTIEHCHVKQAGRRSLGVERSPARACHVVEQGCIHHRQH